MVNGEVLPHKYFEFPRDVLLVGLTDGFQLFKRGKATAWPLVYINCNLAPGDRYSVNTVLCAGIIPGPKKPKNFDSFLYVVARDLGTAAAGIPTYDALADESFRLHIYALIKSGDMQAVVAAWLKSKAPGARVPCHTCPIEGI